MCNNTVKVVLGYCTVTYVILHADSSNGQIVQNGVKMEENNDWTREEQSINQTKTKFMEKMDSANKNSQHKMGKHKS